jgi:hypothetical protein
MGPNGHRILNWRKNKVLDGTDQIGAQLSTLDDELLSIGLGTQFHQRNKESNR